MTAAAACDVTDAAASNVTASATTNIAAAAAAAPVTHCNFTSPA